MSSASLILLVADGLRPDTLAAALDDGQVPALAALRDEGALHTVTTVFPSVTAVAYAPFLTGCFPGPLGLPGLRWLDRSRRIGGAPGHARSYTGPEMRCLDADLDPRVPTLFELLPRESLGFVSLVTRGLHRDERGAAGPGWTVRAARAHVAGDVDAWLALDRRAGEALADAVRTRHPRFVLAAFTGTDKAAHADGHASPRVLDALRTIDHTVEVLRRDAERDGRWPGTQIWLASDHGHAPVSSHDELASTIRAMGFRVRAHPMAFIPGGEVAVMVSGNAMAHLYLDPARRHRRFAAAMDDRWIAFTDSLLRRPSVDLAAIPVSEDEVLIRSDSRGDAVISRCGAGFTHRHLSGDPLRLNAFERWTSEAVHEASLEGPYPDAVVQLLSLACSERAGDVVLSASPGWDFRARFEPIPHRSTHGALHRDQMLVPLLLCRPCRRRPRRSVDVMPSVLRLLGRRPATGIDGVSFA